MNELVLIRYIHFIGIMIVFAMVCVENILLKPAITRKTVKQLFNVDGLYGLFSLIVVAAGLYLWFGVGKPAAYYSQNGIFHTKVGLFIVVGILSIWPTVFYFKNRKGDENDMVEIPNNLRRIVRVEILLLIIIPILATLMAQGVGL